MSSSQQRRLRHAVIGIAAGIFNSHRAALALPEVELVAVSDINEALGEKRADELHCAFYKDYRAMLAETRPDVVVLLTPPFLHASMAIASLQAGCHVLTEKPMAVQVAEADAMIEAARQNQRLLGVIFQHHFRPEIGVARKLLREGLLGKLQHIELFATWTRPASYYQLASWRATWQGEGGGVLTNQASHNLDLLCDLVGMPQRVFAWTRRLLHHDIETEDTVQAMLEWSDGMLGSVHISTAELDTPERIKIIGTSGSLEIGRNALTVQTFDTDMSEYRVKCSNPYGSLGKHPYPVTWEATKGDHVSVYRDFHAAILHGKDFYADGPQARRELELANAMIYSSYEHCEVELPLDRQRYASLLEDLRQHRRH